MKKKQYRNRIYKHGKLSSWNIRNCRGCGKFLRVYDEEYCSRCSDKNKEMKTRLLVYRHSERFSIGDIV